MEKWRQNKLATAAGGHSPSIAAGQSASEVTQPASYRLRVRLGSGRACLDDDAPSIRHQELWCVVAMRGVGVPLVALWPWFPPSASRGAAPPPQASSRLRLLPASHAACGETDWLAAICTETQRAAAAVAGSAHDTASASAACSSQPFTSTSPPYSLLIFQQ